MKKSVWVTLFLSVFFFTPLRPARADVEGTFFPVSAEPMALEATALLLSEPSEPLVCGGDEPQLSLEEAILFVKGCESEEVCHE